MKQFAFALEFLNSILNANYCLDTTFPDGFCMAINLFANHYPLEDSCLRSDVDLVQEEWDWRVLPREEKAWLTWISTRAPLVVGDMLWRIDGILANASVSLRRLPAFLPVPPSRDLPCPLPPFCLPAWWRFGGCVRPLSLLASLHLSRSIGVLLKLVQFFTTHLRKCCLHT